MLAFSAWEECVTSPFFQRPSVRCFCLFFFSLSYVLSKIIWPFLLVLYSSMCSCETGHMSLCCSRGFLNNFFCQVILHHDKFIHDATWWNFVHAMKKDATYVFNGTRLIHFKRHKDRQINIEYMQYNLVIGSSNVPSCHSISRRSQVSVCFDISFYTFIRFYQRAKAVFKLNITVSFKNNTFTYFSVRLIWRQM